MTTTSCPPRARWRRLAAPATMLAGGGALTGATVAGGAAVALTVVEAVLTIVFAAGFWWIGRTGGDFGALFASRPDERQRGIDLRATAASGLAVCLFSIVMAVVTVAQGHSGAPWTTLCAVFGGVYLLSLAFFRR
jgi:hypothetical protein